MRKTKTCATAVLAGCMAALLMAVGISWALVRTALPGQNLPGLTPPNIVLPADMPTPAAQAVVQDTAIDSVRGTSIKATVTAVQGAQNAPLVVLCHGFTGNRAGDGHFAPLAATLAENGICSIAIDFAGNGESEEPFTAYTLESIYDDIESAIAYMEQNYSIDAAKIGLLGHSMGGRAVSLHLGEGIAAAALWSPANGDGLGGLEFLDHSAEGREQLKANVEEAGSLELSGWGVAVSAAYVDGMAESHPNQGIAGYQGALLVAFAGGDAELLSQQTIDETVAAAEARGLPYTNLYGQFEAASHNYGSLAGDVAEGAQIATKIESDTAQFFIETLKGETA